MNIGIISGGAKGVEKERASALRLLAKVPNAEPVFIAVHEAGIAHPDPLHHWAGLHIDRLYERGFDWASKREALGLEMEFTRWGPSEGGNVDREARTWKGGSSGLHALDVALNGLELDGAILCGVPMDDRQNAFTKKGWHTFYKFRPSWERPEVLGVLQVRARSMSGWTRDMLGTPTVTWVRGFARQEVAA